MGLLYDNHNHSQFSFDGHRTTVEATARHALKLGLAGICFTDHSDFYVPETTMNKEKLGGVITDVPAQQAEIDRVQRVLDEECSKASTSGIKVLKGIEIGMHATSHDVIRETLAAHSFDQVIASVHYVDDSDPYYGEYYEGRDWKESYGHYLETIYREMVWMEDFDVMGHYDYIVRYAPYPQACITYHDFSDILDEMFRYLISEGKALEFNTKSYQTYHGRTPVPDPDVLKRYRELGGEIVSLGSDSHDADRVGLEFPRYAALLRSAGFRWLAHFEERRLVQTPL